MVFLISDGPVYFRVMFEDGDFDNNSNPAVTVNIDEGSFQSCWSAFFEAQLNTFKMEPVTCDKELATICYKFLQTCDSNKTEVLQQLDVVLNPSRAVEFRRDVLYMQTQIRDIFTKINFSASYESWMTNLWQSSLPCFDTVNITASYNGERSLLKSCQWKGKFVPCSAIFTKVATDQGFCCAFNAEAADKMYSSKTYTGLIQKLQERDHRNAFENGPTAKGFLNSNEPQSQAGVSKGLVIFLDAHTNILAPSSVSPDFKGFQGLISAKGEFPNVDERGFIIRPGMVTHVAMSATRIEAKNEIRELEPWQRKCIFAEETLNLTLHRKYSPQNCLFECIQNYTKQMMEENKKYFCSLWIFPTKELLPEICDPYWEREYLDISRSLPEAYCEHCLPTCTSTYYHYTVTSSPFQRCSDINFGISYLCDITDKTVPDPKIWAEQVKKEYGSNAPKRVKNLISNIRPFGTNIFNKTFANVEYDAFDEDIAIVKVFFDTPAIFLYSSQPAQTWLDFFAAIGGLLGLCFGFSIITIIELIWLCMQLGKNVCVKKFKHSN
jgi:Amiloride-sensitive sodium channel